MVLLCEFFSKDIERVTDVFMYQMRYLQNGTGGVIL